MNDYRDRYSEETLEVVFDTETTGLGSKSSILSIGWALQLRRITRIPIMALYQSILVHLQSSQIWND